MRRTALFVLLILCVCTAGASAQTMAAMTKDDFLASLRSPEPVNAARSQFKQACTVTLHCAIGYFLSCSSGSGNCQSGPTWVRCDGVQQDCPVCYKSVSCGCDCGTVDCFGWSSCSSGARRVTCDGVTYACPPIRQCCLP